MNPTIVIGPGGWPLVQSFEPLIRAFEAKHHNAVCKVPVTYPDTPPNVNPDSHHFRTHVLDPILEEGKDVIVLLHSYGGIYGPESLEGTSKKERKAKGLAGGVIAVILVAAFVVPKGTSAITAMGVDEDNLPVWFEHDLSTGLVALEKGSAKAMVFHDLPDEEAERLANMLHKHPYVCFSTPTRWDPYQDPNFQGTLGYIFTGADKIIPLEAQRTFVRTGGIEHTYLLENASHSPYVEQPEELAEVVLKLVRNITENRLDVP